MKAKAKLKFEEGEAIWALLEVHQATNSGAWLAITSDVLVWVPNTKLHPLTRRERGAKG